MFNTILVPLDGSDLAEQSLVPAKEMQEKFGSKLIILRTVESLSHYLIQTAGVMEPASAAAANVELAEEVAKAEHDEAQTYLKATAAKLGGNVEALIAEGQSAETIIKVAEEKGADVIVISSHGRGGLGRLVHGSTANEVLQHSKVPVLYIRPQGKS